jgi:hypothetical protein
VVDVLEQGVYPMIGGEQVLGLHQRGEAGAVAVDDDPRIGDLMRRVHPAGEHAQDGRDDAVPARHERWLRAPSGGGRAEVKFGVGGEGGGEQLLVLHVLAEPEAVQRVDDLGAVPHLLCGCLGVAAGG